MSGKIEPELQKLLDVTHIMLQAAAALFDFEATYTPISLKAMEKTIDQISAPGLPPLSPASVIPFGVYLGETIIKNIPLASWHTYPESQNPFELALKIGVKEKSDCYFLVFPLVRVESYWHDRTDTIFGWFHMIQDISEGIVDPMDPEKSDQWRTTNGARYRFYAPNAEEAQTISERHLPKK